MNIFITGTDTDIGKTVVSSWLCVHTNYSYFKPIQTGSTDGTDTQYLSDIINTKTFQESYVFKKPVSPHIAAKYEQKEIDITNIKLPQHNKLIIEGAGGVLVPINDEYYMVDLIKQLDIPVILVTKSYLGTINHTLLSIEALRARNINILGVIINGENNIENSNAIKNYGQVKILGQLPYLKKIDKKELLNIPLPNHLTEIL